MNGSGDIARIADGMEELVRINQSIELACWVFILLFTVFLIIFSIYKSRQ